MIVRSKESREKIAVLIANAIGLKYREGIMKPMALFDTWSLPHVDTTKSGAQRQIISNI